MMRTGRRTMSGRHALSPRSPVPQLSPVLQLQSGTSVLPAQVSGRSLHQASTPPSQAVGVTAGVGAILVDHDSALVVRSGPGDQYFAMATLTAGMTMTVMGTDDAWYHVAIGNAMGWVPASGVAVQTPACTAPAGDHVPSCHSPGGAPRACRMARTPRQPAHDRHRRSPQRARGAGADGTDRRRTPARQSRIGRGDGGCLGQSAPREWHAGVGCTRLPVLPRGARGQASCPPSDGQQRHRQERVLSCRGGGCCMGSLPGR